MWLTLSLLFLDNQNKNDSSPQGQELERTRDTVGNLGVDVAEEVLDHM
jgi:hypothetical protein